MINRNRKMDCNEFIRLVPTFLKDELLGRQAYRFLEHMEECDECREELNIQFLVMEGTARLESGGSLNLDKELNVKVAEYEKMLKKRRIMNSIVYVMEVIAVFAVIFILLLVFYKH